MKNKQYDAIIVGIERDDRNDKITLAMPIGAINEIIKERDLESFMQSAHTVEFGQTIISNSGKIKTLFVIQE